MVVHWNEGGDVAEEDDDGGDPDEVERRPVHVLEAFDVKGEGWPEGEEREAKEDFDLQGGVVSRLEQDLDGRAESGDDDGQHD